ncbi:DUF6924 domain-containing protein [Streptomyces actinomycinicus]|uniref:DUF6924 domain-containing protein n=1 Tax=Streptomyces actinomycinicus TaxID=1695166 RepID=UPI001F166EAD|nr:hypothetical protein [Streptomyces actinomycinicus]
MSFPGLPQPAPGHVQLISTCYEDGRALWGGLLDVIGGRRDGEVLVLEDGGVRLQLVEGREWDHLYGGNVPALVPGGPLAPGGTRVPPAVVPPVSAPPVAVLADVPVVYGGDGPLLVDLAAMPGRGVRVPSERLGEVLAAVSVGTLAFDDLVREMDRYGTYQGDGGRPAFPVPTDTPLRSLPAPTDTPRHDASSAPTFPPRHAFPALPSTGASLLVRTSFDDEDGWHALLDELGGADADGWVGADLDPDETDMEHCPLAALLVDDRAFEGLLPGQVPALVPPEEHTTLVALADARTFTEPGRPLTVVDLYDTPGRTAVLPCRDVGSMACNLEIANMDFHEFIEVEDVEGAEDTDAVEDVRPWWEA